MSKAVENRPAPWGALVFMLALLLLGYWATTQPAGPSPEPVGSAVRVENGRYYYTSPGTVTGVHITTTGIPTALPEGWATGPAIKDRGIWYAYGLPQAEVVIKSPEPVTRLVWILPDGSQQVQEPENPETESY